MHLVESFFISKRGTQEDSEDRIVYTNHFACVIDGLSSQGSKKWNGNSSGKLAAIKLCKTTEELDPETDARNAMDVFTETIASIYREHGLIDQLRQKPIDRIAASIVLYSAYKKQLWFVGDCQALLVFESGTTQAIQNTKRVDEISSTARAMFVESELVLGKTISALQKDDTGRKFIRELIERQFVFQNTERNSEYVYSVIDGFPVSDTGIKVVNISEAIRSVVLASDGYPKLFPTLDETEAYRTQVLKTDPLLIGVHKSVRSYCPENDSYDDRAYLRLSLVDEGRIL